MPPRPSDALNSDADLDSAARRALQQAGPLIGGSAGRKFMREGGTNVGPNNQTGEGTLRKQTGRLVRSLIGTRQDRGAAEGIFDISPVADGQRLTFGSNVPYAAVHEYGFSGTVQVPAHQREQTHVFGTELDSPRTVQVSAHSREMTMPERPYLRPALRDQTDEIVGIVEDEVAKELTER